MKQLLAISALTFGLAACSAVQSVGDLTGNETLQKAAGDMTPRQEYYLGRTLAAGYCQGPVKRLDVPFNQYLNQLGQYLASRSSRPELYKGYFFSVVSGKERTALSTPGGHVLVSTSLIESLNSEDELAGVLAHELAHIAKRHAAAAIKKSYQDEAVSDSALGVVSFFAGDKGGMTEGLGGGLLDAGASVMEKGFNRDQEVEADLEGLAILRRAHYDGNAFLAVLRRQDSKGGGLVSNHPSDAARLKAMEAALQSTPASPLAAEGLGARTARFLAAKAALAAGL